MSRIGKRSIQIPEKVTVEVKDAVITVTGPKGELSERLHPFVSVAVTPEGIVVSVKDPSIKKQSAMWGTFAALIRNMLIGVTQGYSKKLEVSGVGYTWNVAGKKVVIKAGYSHPVEMEIPEGLTAALEEGGLLISGISKQSVGEFAAQIRKVRKPEPYKGKGIRYSDEQIRRKAGKQAATA